MVQVAPSNFIEAATPQRNPRRAFLESITGPDTPSLTVEQINALQGVRDDVDGTIEASSPGYRQPSDPNRTPSDQRSMEVWEREPLVAEQ